MMMKTSIKNIDCIKIDKKEKYNEFGYIWEFTFAVDGELFKLLDESNYNYDELKFLEKDLEWELQVVGDKRCVFSTEFFDKDGGLEDEDAEELHTWQDTVDICAEDLLECFSDLFNEGDYFITKFEGIIPSYISEEDVAGEFDSYCYSFSYVNEMTEEQGRKMIDKIIRDCTVEFTAFSNEDSDIFITGSYMSLDIFEEDFQWEDNQGFWQDQFPRNPFNRDDDEENHMKWDRLKQNLLSDAELTQILTDFCNNQDYEFERDGYKLRIN